MKLLLLLSILSFGVFANNETYDQTIKATIKAIEKTYEASCSYKKDTMATCLGSLPSHYGYNPGVCYYSKKFTCKSKNVKFSVKFKMREDGFADRKTKLLKAVVKLKKEIEETNIQNSISSLEENLGQKCEFKKDTFAKCVGFIDAGIPFNNVEQQQSYVPALCYYSKKYECSNGSDEMKVSYRLKETRYATKKTKLRKIVIKY